MSVLSWGKPRTFRKNLDETDSKWVELPTAVENSVQLTTTKGDKKEAKIEGGEYEDIKYAKNTYALAENIRAAKGRQKPFKDVDGVVPGNYAFALQPEDPKTPGLCFLKSAVSVEDTYTSEEGGVWVITFDALKSAANKNQIYWGLIEVTEADGAISKIECDPTCVDETAEKFVIGE
jgi:hypothetical protein